jgi:hypothetical protein
MIADDREAEQCGAHPDLHLSPIPLTHHTRAKPRAEDRRDDHEDERRAVDGTSLV